MASRAKAHVLYDGQCALCRNSVAMLQRLDWLGRLAYVDVRTSDHPLLKTSLLDGAPLLEQMHLVTPDQAAVHRGFFAIRWMSWRLPPLWPLAPLLLMPGAANIGQHLYLWIARHRFQLVPCHGGVCTIQQKFSAAPGLTATTRADGDQAS